MRNHPRTQTWTGYFKILYVCQNITIKAQEEIKTTTVQVQPSTGVSHADTEWDADLVVGFSSIPVPEPSFKVKQIRQRPPPGKDVFVQPDPKAENVLVHLVYNSVHVLRAAYDGQVSVVLSAVALSFKPSHRLFINENVVTAAVIWGAVICGHTDQSLIWCGFNVNQNCFTLSKNRNTYWGH